MANGDIGYSWQPGATTPGGTGAGGPSGVKGASPQQAVKILSLRVPERPSATQIAPQALLTSKGSAAAGAQGLDTLVAALMQAFQPPVTSGAPQVPGAPVSRVPGRDGSPQPGIIPAPPQSPLPPVQEPPGLPAPGGGPRPIPPPRVIPRDGPLPNVEEPGGLPAPPQRPAPAPTADGPMIETSPDFGLPDLSVSNPPSAMPSLFDAGGGADQAYQQLQRRRGFFDQ